MGSDLIALNPRDERTIIEVVLDALWASCGF